MNRSLFLIIIASISLASSAQVSLLPSIVDGPKPLSSEAICEIPQYPLVTTSFEEITFDGEIIPDFTLYTTDGDPFVASEVLNEGKPLLLISGSYSCWVYRDNTEFINLLQSLYGDIMNIAVVYTVEAHSTDISPYFGDVVIGGPNIEDDVLVPQAETYGQRKGTANEMLINYPLNVPLLIDAPCNEWWLNFGTNPNCAFFIAPDGEVIASQRWFNRYPEDILAVISEYFDLPYDPADYPVGNFEITDYDASCVNAFPGATIITPVYVSNPDDKDSQFNITRLAENFPEGWSSSLCTDICYPPDVDETDMILEAETDSYFSFYFYTNEIDGYGSADILVEHALYPESSYLITLSACTGDATTIETNIEQREFYIFPNPANSILQISPGVAIDDNVKYSIYDLSGRLVIQGSLNSSGNIIDVNSWSPGIYSVHIQGASGLHVEQIVVQ